MIRNQITFRMPASRVREAALAFAADLDTEAAENESTADRPLVCCPACGEQHETSKQAARSVDLARKQRKAACELREWAAALSLRGEDEMKLQFDDLVFFGLLPRPFALRRLVRGQVERELVTVPGPFAEAAAP